MSLKLWLPLNGNLDNQGLSSATITNGGATVSTSGKIGSCYSFDGDTDFISIDCSDLYNILSGTSQQFTIAFWIYHADSTRGIIFGDFRLDGSIGVNLELSTDHKIRFYWDGDPDKTFNTALTVSTWTHCTIVYNGNQILLYKDGVLQSDTYTGTLSQKSKTSGLFYLGRDSRTGTTALNGMLNDFRVYNNALSAKEIAELAKGLVLHYTLSGFGQYNLVKTSSPIYNLSTSMERIDNGVVTKGVNSDTYFRLALNSTLVADTTYTLSFYATELPSGSVLRFGLGGQNNTYDTYCGDVSVHGGLNVFTFTPSKNISTAIIMDDQLRTGLPVVRMTYFKIEEGSKPTPWLPNSADPLYSAMGFGDNVEYDVSGYGNDGTKHNTIMFTPDTPRYLTSSIFNGSNTYIEANSLPSETKTVSVWVKTSWASSSGYKFVFHDKGTGLAIGFSDTKIITYVGGGKGGTGSAVQTSGKYLANEWNHIVVVKTGDKTRTVYVNGEQMPTTSNNYWGGDINKLLIGVRHISGNYKDYINGQISDFRAYATELSEEDILALYHAPISLANNGTLLTQGEYVEV